MLLPDVVVNVKTTLADVTCQVADGIATVYSRWQILLPSGRCYSHNRVVFFGFIYSPRLFHLPQTKQINPNTPPYCGYNICHLAITSATCYKHWLFMCFIGLMFLILSQLTFRSKYEHMCREFWAIKLIKEYHLEKEIICILLSFIIK